LSLVFQERPSACGADCIHAEIHYYARAQDYDLGILAADFYHGTHARDHRHRRDCVRCDLVLHHIGAYDNSRQLPSAARGAGGRDLEIPVRISQCAHALLYCFYRAPARPQV
jgi:hypothetical protein